MPIFKFLHKAFPKVCKQWPRILYEGSNGILLIGGESRPRVCDFKSSYHILDCFLGFLCFKKVHIANWKD